MSVLKIKNAQGEWQEVPFIKGDKGDTYILTEEDKEDIAGLVDIPIQIKYVKDDESDNGGVIEGSVTGDNINIASGQCSHAEGYKTKAIMACSHAEGSKTEAKAINSHTEGENTIASGINSHAEGYYTTASNKYSHTEGNHTTASGQASHAEGTYTKATGTHSHSEGAYAQATNDYTHAENYITKATGVASHAEGDHTTASGYASHAEGNKTLASYQYSHAEGNSTTASEMSSHAEGDSTVASGSFSHAEGLYTIAQRKSQHVSGEYNIADTGGTDERSRGDYVVIVGNGTLEISRSNAYTLDWQGNGVYSGKLTVGTAPTNDMDVATKKYVDDVKGASIHICSSEEYDSTTGVPTIQNPDERTFYLVPSADGTSPDLFVEWAYINNAWEMFGSMSIDLSGYLTDVTVDGNSVVTDGVANVPTLSQSQLGVAKINTAYGTGVLQGGTIGVHKATSSDIKTGTHYYRPIVPISQHEATFYGLAKASGDATQSQSSNAVGTYTDEAKASIQNMLGVPSVDDIPEVPVEDVQINGTSIVADGVASIPVASTNTLGAIFTQTGYGIAVNSSGRISTDASTSAQIKTATDIYRPLTPSRQHESVFYGLAKASGDATQSASNNPVGTYTDEAKTSIKQMLGVVDSYDSLVVNVTGTDPVITGSPSYRYNCGEVASLTVTPPSSGTIDIIFTSGTTPTVLDLPQTVKMPSWWIGTEANTTYEMCITDGMYCGVMSWDV